MIHLKRLLLILLALVMSFGLIASWGGINETQAAEGDGGESIPMSLDSWTQAWGNYPMNLQESTDGIRVTGLDGIQALLSKDTFDFRDTEVRIKWRVKSDLGLFWLQLASDYKLVEGTNTASATDAKVTGSALAHPMVFMTEYPDEQKDYLPGAAVVRNGSWLYTHFAVDTDGKYTTSTAYGGYKYKAARIITQSSGSYINAEKGQIVLSWMDSPSFSPLMSSVEGPTKTPKPSYVEITEAIIVPNDRTEDTKAVKESGVLTINIKTSKQQYRQGEAVVLTGQLLYNDKPVKLGPQSQNQGFIRFEVGVPKTNSSGGGTVDGTLSIRKTDDEGKFSGMPFAGYNLGEYTIRAKAGITKGIRKGAVSAQTGDIIKLEVVATPPVGKDWKKEELKKIEKLFKEQVPPGPLRGSWKAWQKGETVYEPPMIEVPSVGRTFEFGGIFKHFANVVGFVPESQLGSINNVFSNLNIWEGLNEFVCGGYQAQSLDFFHRLQFNEDPAVRELLIGMDYGPVARGYIVPGSHYLLGHHAVSLHPINANWKDFAEIKRIAAIFDPWPRQTPDVVTVEEFEGPGGFCVDPWAKQATDQNKVFSGYPLTDGRVYVNPFFGGDAPKFEPMKKETSGIFGGSPVNMLVTNAKGDRVGALPDGSIVQEFPSNIQHFDSKTDDGSWYIGLPDGSFDLTITGTGTGTFRLLTSGKVAGNDLLDYGKQPTTPGEEAHIKLDSDIPGMMLVLADGSEVAPTVLVEGNEVAPIVMNGGDDSGSGDGEMSRWLLIGIAVVSFLIALGLASGLKFLPVLWRLFVFLMVLIGGIIGGVLGTGHNLTDLITVIRTWGA